MSLKTGNYEPATVAFTMKVASEAKVDYVAFDGAGGGTGMSPVPMMNEQGTPTVYLEAQVLKCAQILRKKGKGKHIPDILMAGGFIDGNPNIQGNCIEQLQRWTLCKGSFDGKSAIDRGDESVVLRRAG
ncbi:MAG: glutamate synthase-related protein [Candidatus Bathyarchaeia archaeon]